MNVEFRQFFRANVAIKIDAELTLLEDQNAMDQFARRRLLKTIYDDLIKISYNLLVHIQ